MATAHKPVAFVDIDERAEQQNSDIDIAEHPFTSKEAKRIKRHIADLIAKKKGDPSPTDTDSVVVSYFGEVCEAATSFVTSLDIRAWPVGPRLDWRPRLRRLKEHPSGIRRLLQDEDYEQLLKFGCVLAGVPKYGWREQLASSPSLIGKVVEALMQDKLVTESGGRETDRDLLTYLGVIADVYQAASGRALGRSVSFSANYPEKSSLVRGPAVRFMKDCVEPFLPSITDDAIAERIRELKAKDPRRASR